MAKIHALKKSKAEPQPPGSYTPVITPCRFKNPLSKWRVWRNEAKCIQCGTCVEVCPYGVHTKAGKFIRKPKSHLCLGPGCAKNDFYCVGRCPTQALTVRLNPVLSGQIGFPPSPVDFGPNGEPRAGATGFLKLRQRCDHR